jgi:hypothetical protein
MAQKADLTSARAKLDWANAQIAVLDVEILAFLDREPYRVREKAKPHFQRVPNAAQLDLFEKGRFFEIFLTEDIPASVKASVGMIIQAQRDSLDHLAHALAKKNGAVEPTDVYFTISDSESGFADPRAQRKLRRLSESDRNIIKTLKPYKGGNDLLYALHWLNNKSKHRDLCALATAPKSFGLRGGDDAPTYIRRILLLPRGNTLCPNEQIVCVDATGDLNLYLSATIAFREIGHAQDQPTVEMLREFSRLTASIIDLFA